MLVQKKKKIKAEHKYLKENWWKGRTWTHHGMGKIRTPVAGKKIEPMVGYRNGEDIVNPFTKINEKKGKTQLSK